MKIFHNPKLEVIDYLDERFYTLDGLKFYPSSTTILESYPKGYGFYEWLKRQGNNADQVVKEAGEQGTKIHKSIDAYLLGEKLTWVKEDGTANYTMEEWKMLNRFVEFENKWKPQTIAQEISLLDEELGYGGTIDRVCVIDGVIWMIDYKSSNYLWKVNELQLASYIALWNRMYPEFKIQKHAALHLKAQTRGEAKDSIQGKGWQLKPYERIWQDAYKIFDHVKHIWTEEHPNYVPKNEQYPDSLQMIKEVKKITDVKEVQAVGEKVVVTPPPVAGVELEKAEIKKTPKGWGEIKKEEKLPVKDDNVEIN